MGILSVQGLLTLVLWPRVVWNWVMLRISLGMSTNWNVGYSTTSVKFPEGLERFWNVAKVSEYSGKFPESVECFWTVWKVPEKVMKFSESLESFWTVGVPADGKFQNWTDLNCVCIWTPPPPQPNPTHPSMVRTGTRVWISLSHSQDKRSNRHCEIIFTFQR